MRYAAFSGDRLAAYRLESSGATIYTPIVPNHGLYESRVLGLEVQVEEDHLRFSLGTALLFESEELVVHIQAMADATHQRAEEAEQRREEEVRLREESERRRDEVERRRDEVEQENARLREEIERLKRGSGPAEP